ncbi:MAG: 50S ribosomal protein L11 methyltransferase [Negativicutes bacterium]|nr:50S ribosomal protein L11 methyltransferase [Negativicutes bacterium]
MWTEIIVAVSRLAEDAVCGIMDDLGCTGLTVDNPAASRELRDRVQADYWSVDTCDGDIINIRGFWPAGSDGREITAQIVSRCHQLAGFGLQTGDVSVRAGVIIEQDWLRVWRESWQPVPVGDRLLIWPGWKEIPTVGVNEKVIIRIDPDMAFGTGDHPTTRMCLTAVEQMVSPGCEVWDVGCGSGILAIAAALLGAGRVRAVDNDPAALAVARENVRRNDVSQTVEVRRGNLVTGMAGKADLIFANLSADAVIALAGAAGGHLLAGGRLVASGIVAERCREVVQAMVGAGWTILEIEQDSGWTMVVAGRKYAATAG